MAKRPRMKGKTPTAPRAHLSIAQAKRLTQKTPKNAEAWKQLGLAFTRENQYDSAIEAFQHASTLDDSVADTYAWLTVVYHSANRLPQARASAEQALARDPENVKALVVLARMELDSGRASSALKRLEKAEQHEPSNEGLLLAKGKALFALNRFDDAQALFQKLTQRHPNNLHYWNELGIVQRELGELEEGARSFRNAMALGQDPVPFANLITGMHYDPAQHHDAIAAMCREWQGRYGVKNPPPRPVPENLSPTRKLRVGLLSDGLRQHPVGNMIIGALENISPEEVEFFFYTTNLSSDEVTKRFHTLATHWSDVKYTSDEQFAQQVRNDEIDILFDLAGHNAGTRSRAISMHPAPLMVKWVGGLINTTGVEAIDYLISDHIETPDGEDEHYTEKLIRLPDDYIVYARPLLVPSLSSLPAKKNGYITLGCFNNPTKLNGELFSHWAQIMHQLPNSRLLLKGKPYTSQDFCERIYTQFEQAGIERERLLLEGPAPHHEFLAAYNRVDISLDTWPYSGGLTTCESFLMGVPVVTLPGPTFAGRHSATHLINAGMPELVVDSWEVYHERVLELASDLDSLSTIRQHLRDVLLQSPVCDAPRFAKHLTMALRAIWQRYCEGKAPEALTFNKEGELWFEDDKTPLTISVQEKTKALASAEATEEAFTWQLQGKLIAIDNGGRYLTQPAVQQMLTLKSLELIAFDPAGELNSDAAKNVEGVHYYSSALLGNGEPATLYACLDPAQTATLVPLESAWLPAALRNGNKVLTQLPVNTLSLDKIDGLPTLDWLVLDARHDASEILEHGIEALKETLLIDVGVAFQPTHERQPSLAELQHWASRNGFRFYRLNEPRHSSHLPEHVPAKKRQATELESANALFLPSHERMAELSDSQRTKLAFLLHTVYGIKDMAYALLAAVDEEKAERYLVAEGLVVTHKKPLQVPRALNNVKDIMHYLEQVILSPISANHPLPNELIVSLTSYKARFKNLHLTLRSLLLQKVLPDRLILWIAEDEKADLPENVWELEGYGLSIRFCEDIRSYKKIIPTLREFPDSFIVTADDDIYYEPNWLKGLIDSWDGSKKTIVAHRAHKIKFDKKGNPLPYQQWKWQVGSQETIDGLIFPTGCGGVLYPPYVFHKDVTNEKRFMELCPNADDIWLYWMASTNGVKAKRSDYDFRLIEWPSQDSIPLWQENLQGGGNDKNIKQMLKFYGKPWENITPDNSKFFSFSHLDEKIYFSLPNANDHIQKIIKSTRSFYEIEMLEDIRSRMGSMDAVFDIGSNIGNHTIFFAKFLDARKVFAFEPHPDTYNTLCMNIKANHLDKVHSYNAGISDSPGKAVVSFYDDSNTGMSKLKMSSSGGIELFRADDIAKEHGVKVGLMKIDVEGMELSVLKGSQRILIEDRPVLYVEAGEKNDFKQIANYLALFGYKAALRFNATATYLFLYDGEESFDKGKRAKEEKFKIKSGRYDSYFQSNVIITGCGRSGTKALSEALLSSGINLPHEYILNHRLDKNDVCEVLDKTPCLDYEFYGESSWLTVPFLDLFSKKTKIVYLLRDPVKIAMSLYELGNTNCFSNSPSIRFAQKMLPEMATDDELHNACAYAILWNEMAFKKLEERENYIFFSVENPDLDRLSSFLGISSKNLSLVQKNKRSNEKIREIEYERVESYMKSIPEWKETVEKIYRLIRSLSQ